MCTSQKIYMWQDFGKESHIPWGNLGLKKWPRMVIGEDNEWEKFLSLRTTRCIFFIEGRGAGCVNYFSPALLKYCEHRTKLTATKNLDATWCHSVLKKRHSHQNGHALLSTPPVIFQVSENCSSTQFNTCKCIKYFSLFVCVFAKDWIP